MIHKGATNGTWSPRFGAEGGPPCRCGVLGAAPGGPLATSNFGEWLFFPRTRVNKGMKKDRSVEAPILPPPRCASFLEQRSSTSRRTLQEGLSHREFTYLLGGYLPIDSAPPFYGGALQLDRVLQHAYSRVPRPRRCRRSNFHNIARVNWVAVTGVALSPEGVLASTAPTTRARRARTLTPTVTSKVVRFIIYPSCRW